MKSVKIIFVLVLASSVLTACWNTGKQEEKMESSNSSSKLIESMDTSKSMAPLIGMFKGENEHMVNGNVLIKDGKLVLTNFKTDEGPDLHVYVSKGTDISKARPIDKIDLTKERQTFDLSEVNVEDYDTVLIYCNKANELFGSAVYKKETAEENSMIGIFNGLNEKMVEGTVSIVGNKVMLSNFKTDKGPDLNVYLIREDEIENAVKIGKLDLDNKEQIFTIPMDISIKDFKKIAIYCDEADVFFGKAVL